MVFMTFSGFRILYDVRDRVEVFIFYCKGEEEKKK